MAVSSKRSGGNCIVRWLRIALPGAWWMSYAIRPPDLVIVDAILGMEGIGPTQGKPRAAGWLLISNDGVLLDHTAVTLMGYDPGADRGAAHGYGKGIVALRARRRSSIHGAGLPMCRARAGTACRSSAATGVSGPCWHCAVPSAPGQRIASAAAPAPRAAPLGRSACRRIRRWTATAASCVSAAWSSARMGRSCRPSSTEVRCSERRFPAIARNDEKRLGKCSK